MCLHPVTVSIGPVRNAVILTRFAGCLCYDPQNDDNVLAIASQAVQHVTPLDPGIFLLTIIRSLG